MASEVLRLATRGSALAVAQSSWVAKQLEATGVRVEIVTVRTTGDAVQDRPLYDIGGKGLFTKEVEQALLRGEADVAVHSFKDLPVTMPLVDGAALVVAAVPVREDVRDVLVTREGCGLADLEAGARLGTTSPRRQALVRDARPDLRLVPMRGNVDTRLGKLASGECDALLLAAAGLNRLGRFDPATHRPLDPESFVPAAGQGALAIQCRREDSGTIQRLAGLDDVASRQAVELEREVVLRLEGNCTSPIGAWWDGRRLRVAADLGSGVRRVWSDSPAEAVGVVGVVQVVGAVRSSK
jgi:hydroxymethylbilane synthase